jgi:hypothetical protein
MYEGAQRAVINNTATHSRNDANGMRKRDINDHQYRRKGLCRRHFHYMHLQRLLLDRRHDDSSKGAGSARRGL